jgi:tRNA(His) guanylyltransferase
MANLRFEYVRSFERENVFPQETFLVVRVDGRGFHKFSAEYEFAKPNDAAALAVMNAAARAVMAAHPDVVLAYGDLDEYLFLLHRRCQLFDRRELKLVSTFASTFTAHYLHQWLQAMPHKPLRPERLPTFDARVVMYPNAALVRDYFSWRQVDCHINNLYNTTFWALVERGGLTPQQAEQRLKGTLAADKHEILFSQFQINYNNEPEAYKKGSVLVRHNPNLLDPQLLRQAQRNLKRLRHSPIELLHVDLIKDHFWVDKAWMLE